MSQICGSCGSEWKVPGPTCGSCGKSGSAIEAVKCPMCAELVASGAAACKWCGEPFGAAAVPGAATAARFSPAPPPPPPPPPPAPPDGTSVFVVGILGFLCCQVLGPVAWYMGNNYENRCRSIGLPPDGMATAGKILGIISTILMVLVCLFYGAVITLAIVGGAASSSP